MRRVLLILIGVVLAGGAIAAFLIMLHRPYDEDEITDFLERHWRRPIPPQGASPERFTPVEAALAPDSCGICHPAQLADWKTSLHAAAMGPGVAGQLVEMMESDPETALLCLTCHAPLAEQAPLRAEGASFRKNAAFDPALQKAGLACAACHVRAQERFGPPKRDGSLESAAPRATLPHDGATRTPAFLRSEFCQSCHQFPPDGFALNGKLIENTYNEWKASRYAREGVQCQGCHMPDRRHLWRGIHDPDTVSSGITVTVTAGAPRYRPGQTALVTLRVENTGVGHAFPTYVTPKVILAAEVVDRTGEVVPGSREEKVIGREVTLDLAREVFDTRLLPGQHLTLEYRRKVDRAGLTAHLTVTVYPDAFYTRFFESTLRQGAGRGTADIRRALEATRRSPFTLFSRDVPLS